MMARLANFQTRLAISSDLSDDVGDILWDDELPSTSPTPKSGGNVVVGHEICQANPLRLATYRLPTGPASEIIKTIDPWTPIVDVPDEDLPKAFVANNSDSMLPKSTDWLIDSGCTNHMYHDREEFVDYMEFRTAVAIADGSTVWTDGRGTINIELLLPNGTSHLVGLINVLHVPDLTCGLFSIYQATARGFAISFNDENCYLFKTDVLIGVAPKQGNTYILCITHSSAKVVQESEQNRKSFYNDKAIDL